MQGVDVRVESERSDEDLLAKAREFIDDTGSQPFFLYLHFIDMHDYFFPGHLFEGVDPEKLGLSDGLVALRDMEISQAYDALAQQLNQPGRLTQRDVEYLIGLYDRRLQATDRVIGELARYLQSRDLLGSTILAITADHGEQFLEHGRLVHGADAFYNEVIHIPFIVSNPRLYDVPRRVETPVSCIDFGPTLLDLVGLESPPQFQGESFADGRDQDRVVFATDGRTWKAISRDWSYIVSKAKNREELYNLASDPGESIDLASERPDMVELGRRVVSEMKAKCAAHEYLAIDIEEVMMPKEQEEALRSLGYVE
jgi:arylsulfatase A-like enzyme